jgi:hypothetical protein
MNSNSPSALNIPSGYHLSSSNGLTRELLGQTHPVTAFSDTFALQQQRHMQQYPQSYNPQQCDAGYESDDLARRLESSPPPQHSIFSYSYSTQADENGKKKKEKKAPKPKMGLLKTACSHCKYSHLACEESRPCRVSATSIN